MKTLNKKIVKNISKLLLVLFTFTLIGANANGVTARAAAGASVSYKVTGELKKGNTVTIDVNVANAANLYGSSFDWNYDSTALQVTGIKQGTVYNGKANEIVKNLSTGKVEFASTLTGANEKAATSGSIAVLTVKVLSDKGNVALKTIATDAALATNQARVKLATAGATTTAIAYTATDANLTWGNDAPVVETSTITSFRVDKASGQKVGTSINFTLNASPADQTQYCFFVRNGVGAWQNMQTWSDKNTFTWRPTEAGVYRIRGFVKHNNSTTATNDAYQDIIFVVKDNVSTPVISKLTSFTATPSTGAVNTRTNFAATANPASKALYSFYVKAPGSTTWERIQDYSFKNNVDYTPTKAGTYTVRVHCWNINSNNAATDGYRDLTYTVK